MIAAEVRRGAETNAHSIVSTIVDRTEAIHRAVAVAEEGDFILILGKGHEQGQEINGVLYPFDDRTVAREALTDAGWPLA